MTTPPAEQQSGPTTSGAPADSASAMTLSAEQLRASAHLVASGSARLERYTVTETRSITVEVTCEKVRLVFNEHNGRSGSIDDPPATASAVDPAQGAVSPWLVLSEEQITVTKAMVPVERVRLGTYWVTEQSEVSEGVRAERIELTADGPGRIAD